MKIGGKNGLTKVQFRNLILNLQEIAHEMCDSVKQEEEKEEGKKNEKKKD